MELLLAQHHKHPTKQPFGQSLDHLLWGYHPTIVFFFKGLCFNRLLYYRKTSYHHRPSARACRSISEWPQKKHVSFSDLPLGMGWLTKENILVEHVPYVKSKTNDFIPLRLNLNQAANCTLWLPRHAWLTQTQRRIHHKSCVQFIPKKITPA